MTLWKAGFIDTRMEAIGTSCYFAEVESRRGAVAVGCDDGCGGERHDTAINAASRTRAMTTAVSSSIGE